MLRIPALTPAQQRELRQWQSGDYPRLARRAQVVLWSARSWSVPAPAHVLGCCRRTVRRWPHAFLDVGLVGLLGRSAQLWESQRGPTGDSDSAKVPNLPATDDRLAPVGPPPCRTSGASLCSIGAAIASIPISSSIGRPGGATSRPSPCAGTTKCVGPLLQTSCICGCSISASFLIGGRRNTAVDGGVGAADARRPRAWHGD
jgi:hypothetical protein